MRNRKRRPGQKSIDASKFTKEGKIPISKLDAARRQLETAVNLWFQDRDPVSIHTLVMAVHEILRVLNRARGGRPMMGEPAPHIRPEYTDAWRYLVLRSSHFFKHSARDAEEIHYFAPRFNEAAILDATDCYEQLTGEKLPVFRLFKWYMRLHEPRLFKEDPPVHAPDLEKMSTPEFFSKLIAIASDPAPLEEQMARLLASS